MEENKVGMVERVAGIEDEKRDPIEILDSAVDTLIGTLESVSDAINEAKVDNEKEKKALERMKDLVETGIAPYVVDFAKEMDVFEGGE